MSDAAEKTARLLEALWQRIRPLVEERLALLDRASDAAVAGTLDAQLKLEAMQGAHKLAGSLGMYGFDDGTTIARELEVMLGEDSPDAARLKKLCAALRKSVTPNS